MIQRHNYNGICWWCGKTADSREHKYKKSDITRLFGQGTFKDHDALTRIVGGIERTVQGSNSKELMFEANFCQKCNNERSQPFDRAYDEFINYVHYNSSIIDTKQLRFSSIFQADWLQQRENVIKYYVKHICCRLAESNILVDPNAIAYLNGDAHISCIEMDFHIREDIVAMEAYLIAEKFPEGSVWIGDGIADYHKLTDTFSLFRSHIGYRWLWIYYSFDDTLAGEFNENPNDLLVFESGYLIDPLIFEKHEHHKNNPSE